MKIATLLLTVGLMFNTSFTQNIFENVTISPKTDNINRRYYFVARLERTIKLLNTIHNQNSKFFSLKTIDINDLIKFDDMPTFKHTRIQESIKLMKKNQTLTPLYTVWDDFAAYKFLEDELFIDEFTKEIFLISRNLLLQILPDRVKKYPYKPLEGLPANIINTSSTNSIMDSIDLVTDALIREQNKVSSNYETKIANRLFNDIKKEIHTDQVSERYYYLKRMMKALALLKDLEGSANLAFKFPISSENPFIIFDNGIEFLHDRTLTCIEAMEDEESLEPLFQLWDDFRQFRYIENEHLTREFFFIVFIAYKNLIVNTQPQLTTRSSITDAAELYQKINSLPTEEIIAAIDTMVEIIELIGLNKKITWREWSQEYWWVAPTIIATAAYSYFIKKK